MVRITPSKAWYAGHFLCLLLLIAGCRSRSTSLDGLVTSPGGPVAGAVVRIQTTDTFQVTDDAGRFTLSDLTAGAAITLTAWAPGFYIGGGEAFLAGDDVVTIELSPLPAEDNVDYSWLPSEYHSGQGEDQGCAECHSVEGTGSATLLPVDQWRGDAHSRSATNPRFLSMYLGTDLSGNKSPDTQHGVSRDYGRFPLRPDPDRPYYGPGYKLDFPDTDGNCAACHAPVAAVDAPYQTNPSTVTGVAAEGLACDFCHKIWDVRLNADDGKPFDNMPGVLSFEFRRPPDGHQFFAGPLDDVAPGEDTFLPLQRESQICAPCHFGSFWGIPIYNSFGEWLDSPYSDPVSGRTCQDCHMPSGTATHFARPDKGGLERDPASIFSHKMPGAQSEELLRAAVTMDVTATVEDDKGLIQVTIYNDRTGHHVPTDSPLRHLILLVQAVDEGGQPLSLLDGPVIPNWAGVGDPEQGYYGGQPGVGYAKIIQELWTEVTPTGAYWNQTKIISDNRIPALESDTTSYEFTLPADGDVRIDVTLLFRRAFRQLMDQKGWNAPDIIMAEGTFHLQLAD